VSEFNLAHIKQKSGQKFVYKKNKCLIKIFNFMKNLENYGVQTLDVKELREVEGGNWFVVALVEFIVASIYDYDEAIAAFKDGYNAARQ